MDATSFQTAEQKARAAESRISLAQTHCDLLEATVNAAELYVQALRLAPAKVNKAWLDKKCKELLLKAERVKADTPKPDSCGRVPTSRPPPRPALEQPTSQRRLTTREEIILLEGSKLNGFVFPPWKDDPHPDEFSLDNSQELFVDSPSLCLSSLQLKTFAGWERPWDALGRLDISQDGIRQPTRPTMERTEKIDLVQDMTSDCSVVASLCAGSARAERGHPRIFSSVMFPYDHAKMLPTISPSSKYILRFYFNGCYRKVMIDDLLPSSTDSRLFYVVDRCNPGYLWPALMEKAYLKVRGGYDFPGSNSGTDLAVLTGWLPEQVFLHDADVMPEELWSRILNAFTFGDVFVTIGTGKLSKREQIHFGLAAEHDYTVLDMREEDGAREMLIKNPWSGGDIWKGIPKLQPATDDSKEDHLSALLQGLSTKDENEVSTPGTFWMQFGSIFQRFENLYLNWNPGLFSHRQDHHFTWDLSTRQSIIGSFEGNPQFCVDCSQSGPLWLLLNRHFRTGDYQSKGKRPHGFISLYLFKKGGQRVLLSDGPMARGPYMDSPNTLIKLEAKANTAYTVVAAAQDLPAARLNFTLSAFSRSPIRLSPAQKQYQSVITNRAAWTRSTAGGNSESPKYLNNPQFLLKLSQRANIAILLAPLQSEADPRLAVHAKIFFTDGSRVVLFRTRDLVADSGEYRRGSAALEATIEQGTYTIVCSTFEPSQRGEFMLSVHSSLADPPHLQPLPAEGGGLLTTVSGPAIFPSGVNRLLAPLTTSRLTRASFVVQPLYSAHSPLRLTLEQGQGPYKATLATSATSEEVEYNDPAAGVRIDRFDLRPQLLGPGTGGLWVVLQRLGGGSAALHMPAEEGFQILVMAEERVNVGLWGVGDG